MKRTIIVFLSVVFSIIIGSLFMQISKEPDELPVVAEIKPVKAFLIGSYGDLEEAKREASLKHAIINQEDNQYNLYIGLLKEQENIERLIRYLSDNNIYYQIQEYNSNTILDNILEKYELLMLNSESDVAFITLNYKILSEYGDSYEN